MHPAGPAVPEEVQVSASEDLLGVELVMRRTANSKVRDGAFPPSAAGTTWSSSRPGCVRAAPFVGGAFRVRAGSTAPFLLPCFSMAQRTPSRRTADRSPPGIL